MTEVTQADLERMKGESGQALAQHQIECVKQYGKLDGRVGKIEALLTRNTRLLYVILAGMLAVVARDFWATLL